MNSRQIETLLERYFNGETSLEDEKKLRDFFQKENIPPHLLSLKAQFEYFANEHEHEYLAKSFDDKILNEIGNGEKRHQRSIRRRYLYTASGIAASILIILSIFFKLDPLTSKVEDTFDDPMTAYLETKKALLFVSETFNKGVDPIEKITTFDDGVQPLSKLASLNTGIREASKISTFHEKQIQIFNN